LERGYSHDDVMYKWHNHVQPAYEEYLLPYKDQSDRVITNNTHVAEDIIVITQEISKELHKKIFPNQTS
jgi:uridine kinase